MTNRRAKNEEEDVLEEFNKNINSFIEENSNRIVCILAYSIPSEFQPMVITYHKLFNEEVRLKYDSKVYYANHPELPDLLVAYFILVKEGEESDSKSAHEDCLYYINKFAEYNINVTGGVSALFYDVNDSKIIDELHQGDRDTLKEIRFLNL